MLDVQRTIRYVRYNCKELSMDTNKIGTLGFLAGGYAYLVEPKLWQEQMVL
jgi:acetyl esterase/lipase